ncbi:MAG: class I lanthipeptide [Thermoanaerobaculia bacterium]
MKKTVKKLVLAKETVKNLGTDKLQEVKGGVYNTSLDRCSESICTLYSCVRCG